MNIMNAFRPLLVRIGQLPRSFARNRRGNVLMLMAFSVIPLTMSTGMAVDYARAARLQTKLNAAADAAALAAVTEPMMKQDNTAARNAALAMFRAQISGLKGLIWNDSDLDVQVTGNNAATTSRDAVVVYSAKSANAFGGILGMAAISIGGRSSATATAAPNIDFYLALDTSSSMALPTTQQGIADLDAVLECTFACHSNKIQANYSTNQNASVKALIRDNTTYNINKPSVSNGWVNGFAVKIIDANGSYIYDTATVDQTIGSSVMAGDNRTSMRSLCRVSSTNNKNICIYNSDGSYVDSYWYALNKNVRLRVTDERMAARDLMTLAQSYALANSRTYRAALYTFDHATNIKMISALSPDLAAVGLAANNIELVTVNDAKANGRSPSNEVGTEYLFTSYRSIMDKLEEVLPARSGNGSNAPGDTPQAFVFMVTDGMSDENINGRTRSAMHANQLAQCTALKNKGIKIAILYTEYTAASIADDEPGQRAIAEAAIPNIAPRLSQCASPGLMYTVKTDQSISDALQALFTKAVATARLAT